MAIGLIDYPLRDRLAEVRQRLDGSQRETILPEHAQLLSRTTSPAEAVYYLQAVLSACLDEFLSPSDVSVSHPLVRAFLILQAAQGARKLSMTLSPVADETTKSQLIALAEQEPRDWNIEDFEWQLVQALQLGWPDVPVLPDAPVHRIDAGEGSLLLQVLLQVETLRAWGLLS